MIPIETASLFFLASVALALAPGPDNIFVLTQSALCGRKAGLLITLGLCTGLVVHTVAVAVGVAAVFATSAVAFNVLKSLGAAYLLYLAWKALSANVKKIERQAVDKPGSRQLYLRGIVMNVTNPKVAIFFLAFLPQFADPSLGAVAPQVFLLGIIFMVAALGVFGAIAYFSGLLGDWIQKSTSAQLLMNRVAGVVFAGLALKLLLAEH
jgi:threonine/homoserine/homoserine lactone efflux protein